MTPQALGARKIRAWGEDYWVSFSDQKTKKALGGGILISIDTIGSRASIVMYGQQQYVWWHSMDRKWYGHKWDAEEPLCADDIVRSFSVSF
jgi:hypothetical protein